VDLAPGIPVALLAAEAREAEADFCCMRTEEQNEKVSISWR